MKRLSLAVLLLLLLAATASARRQVFPKMDIQRYGDLREAERYQLDVADRLFAQEKWDAAQAEYEKFIKIHPKSIGLPFVQLRVGECQEYQLFTNSAIEEYQAVPKYFPKSREAALATYAIGRCLEQAGEFEKAIAQYDLVTKNYHESAIAGDALWQGADLAERKGKLDVAVAFRKRIAAEYPKCSQMRDACYWLVRHLLISEKNVDGAREYARQVLDPAYAERYLGDVLFGQARQGGDEAAGWADMAVERYKAVLAEHPKSGHAGSASYQIIECYRYTGRPKEATEAAHEHLKRHPKDDNARYVMGLMLESMGKWDDARNGWYLQYANQAAGAAQIGESYWRQRKYKEAEEAFMAAVNKYPDWSTRILYRVGEMHLHYTGQYEKAINYFRQSEYSPPSYLFQIAEANRRWKKYDEALKTLAEIRGFFPDHSPEAMWRQVQVYEQRKQQGDDVRAISLLKKICDDYPRSGQSSNAHGHLEQTYGISKTGGAVKDR